VDFGILLTAGALVPGDTNGDGVLDATDVVLAAEIAGGKIPADAVAMANSRHDDATAEISIEDATRINRHVPRALAKMLNEGDE